ncbi:unnamed protein product [Lymnaea stagnalis]|uniref:EF-hand domain-containing protein n=1 Tax=Lymnaea stagnalis TaxID=6523 RepID=A0AAV2HAM7_LYMST
MNILTPPDTASCTSRACGHIWLRARVLEDTHIHLWFVFSYTHNKEVKCYPPTPTQLYNPQFVNTIADKSSLQFVGSTGEFVERREMTKRFQLPPGTYVVIPSTHSPRREAEFILRMFTEQPVAAGYLDVSTNIPLKPARMTSKDLLSETYDRYAGNDRKMDAHELRGFLTETATIELQATLQFPLESCRTLLALMDEDKSGFLSFEEARSAWKEIKAYMAIFQQFDKNNTNSVDTYELRDMFSRLGFSISTPVLASIVRRYGGRDRTITLEDFIMAICKLTSLFGSFRAEQRSRGVSGEAVEFSMNKFLEVTMLL